MQIGCDECGARYEIPDDKIRPGGMAVRCRHCRNVIRVEREPSFDMERTLLASPSEIAAAMAREGLLEDDEAAKIMTETSPGTRRPTRERPFASQQPSMPSLRREAPEEDATANAPSPAAPAPPPAPEPEPEEATAAAPIPDPPPAAAPRAPRPSTAEIPRGGRDANALPVRDSAPGRKKKMGLVWAAVAVVVIGAGGAVAAVGLGGKEPPRDKGPVPFVDVSQPVGGQAPAADPAPAKDTTAERAIAQAATKEAAPKAAEAPPAEEKRELEPAAEPKKVELAMKAEPRDDPPRKLERREPEYQPRKVKKRSKPKRKKAKRRSAPPPEEEDDDLFSVPVSKGRAKVAPPPPKAKADPPPSTVKVVKGRRGGGGDDFDLFDDMPSSGAYKPKPKPKPAPKPKAKPAPKVASAPASGGAAKAKLTKKDVIGVIKKHKRQVKMCSEMAARKGPAPSGKLKVKFVISQSGRTEGVAVTSPAHKGGVLERCITQSIKRWKFPAHRGKPVPVNMPFNL